VTGHGHALAPLLIYLFVLALVANAFLIAANAARRGGLDWLAANALGGGTALFVLVAFGGFAWLLTRSADLPEADDKAPPPSTDQPPRDPTP